MVVLYTFDPPNVNLHRNESVLMLRISIYTVIRELDDFISEILIYTNQPKELKKMLKLTSNKIQFLKINNRFSNFVKNSKLLKRYDEIFYDGDFIDENEHFRKINGYFGVAHSRTYIMYDIARTKFKDILYLDFDTGIAKKMGLQAMEQLKKINILVEPKTSDSIVNNIKQLYPGLKDENLPKYIFPYACRWNCGIMFVKYSAENEKLLKDIRNIYFKISRDIGFMQSNDEWAIGLGLFKNNLIPESHTGEINYYSPLTLKLLHKNLGKQLPFVHYMDQKSIDSSKKTWKIMLDSWEKFLENDGDEPNFNKPDYTKRNSNEYIWGRFESL